MPVSDKYNRILDALQKLLENQNIQKISVSDIAQTAGIAKGSIYYYFPSKDAIVEALVERATPLPLRQPNSLQNRKTFLHLPEWLLYFRHAGILLLNF